MELSHDILIEAFGLLLDEVSYSGSREELEVVEKYVNKTVLRATAMRLREREDMAKKRIEERNKKDKMEEEEIKAERLTVKNSFSDNVRTVNISAIG